MEIDANLVKKLEELSCLKLEAQEKEEMKGYLKKVLSHFEKIKEVDTKGVPALTSPSFKNLKTREDEVKDFEDKDKLLEETPSKEGKLVKAPLAI